MTLSDLFENIKKEFGIAFYQERKREIEDLISYHLEKSWGQLQLPSTIEVSVKDQTKILQSVARHFDGCPVAYITGSQFFFQSEFLVDSNVLIPRPETEILVEKSIEMIGNEKSLIFDFGTGSGCIGLSIAKACSQSQVVLFDNSEKALEVCRKNQKKMSLENVKTLHFDLMAPKQFPIKEKADLIVANPPYIKQGDPRVSRSVHDFEPHEALYCEDEGLHIPKSWIQLSYQHLKLGGHLLIEFGQNQEIPLTDFIGSTDYSIIEIIADYSGIKRFFKLQK